MTNEELVQRIRSGEREHIATLWQQNAGIIHNKAHSLHTRYYTRCVSCGVCLEDIIQVCFFALYDAIQAYDPGSGYKFTSYMNYPLQNHFKALVGLRTAKHDPLNQCGSLDTPMGEDNDTTRGTWLQTRTAKHLWKGL